MKAYIVSLGCPKNLTDSEAIMGEIAASGGEITLDPKKADTIIVNTCSFLKSARDESMKVIKEMAEYKKKGVCKKLYVAGCLPKYEKIKNQKSKIKMTDQRSKMRESDSFVDSIKLYDSNTPRVKATQPWTAYVKIAEGCDNRCSYCLIPSIRGSLKLRSVDDILKEVKWLAGRGVKEIIFIAQDTTAHPELASILERSCRIEGVEWIRLMYAHPAHITDKLTEVMAKEKKILKYIDMPIQHSSIRILKMMNRKYDKQRITDIIKSLRRKMPGIAIRTSVIAGFPGETEEEFKELCDFIKEMKFDRLGAFEYSREEGTAAYGLKGQVKSKEAGERARKLVRVQKAVSKEINRSFIGKKMSVLVEGTNKKGYYGRSYRDAPLIDGKVLIRGDREKEGKILDTGHIIQAIIISSTTHDLTAGAAK